MTDITPLIPKGKLVIEGYGNGGFRVSGVRYEGAILLQPEKLEAYPNLKLTGLDPSLLQSLLPNMEGVRVLLLGTGEKQHFLTAEQVSPFKLARIVVDCMDTGAACRTYNVLLSEGRNVAALLLP